MADPTTADMLTFVQLLTEKREQDKDFRDLLNELSSALADLVDPGARTTDKLAAAMAQALPQALAAALAPALKAAMQGVPAAQVNVPAAAVNVAAPSWNTLEFEVLETKSNGLFSKVRCTRRA